MEPNRWASPVKLKYLPELAALIVSHADEIAREPDRVSDEVLGQLYIACRDRSNRWMGEIDRCASQDGFLAEALLANRHPLVDLTERILINDILIRTWSAVLVQIDKTNKLNRIESLARNLHLGQMVLRHRVLSRVLASTTVTPDEIKQVNAVREKVERWTDMLIGQLDRRVQKDFAFQPDRAADFEKTYTRKGTKGANAHVWRLVMTGMRAGFKRCLPDSSLVSADDRNVVTTILAALSADVTNVTREELGPRVGTLQL